LGDAVGIEFSVLKGGRPKRAIRRGTRQTNDLR
jgi:hypothetical protein